MPSSSHSRQGLHKTGERREGGRGVSRTVFSDQTQRQGRSEDQGGTQTLEQKEVDTGRGGAETQVQGRWIQVGEGCK